VTGTIKIGQATPFGWCRSLVKKFDLYGGFSGLVLMAKEMTEEEAVRRFNQYLSEASVGYEFRLECTGA